MLSIFASSSDLSREVFETYPDLSNIKSKEDIRKFTENKLEEYKSEIHDSVINFRSDWEKVGKQYLNELSMHMQTDWPDIRCMTAYISINPICPRFLDSFSFFVNFKLPSYARETIAHEILHFLWFKKWKEVFPDANPAEFGHPHLVWRLSEVMAPVILQCNPQIHDLIHPRRWGYNSFVNLKIGNIVVPQYFAEKYISLIKQKANFSDIIKQMWDEAVRHREVLEKF